MIELAPPSPAMNYLVKSLLCTILFFSSISTSLAQSKIVGGTDVPAGFYPWMAALVDRNEPDTFQAQFCGGSLIHESWVVTAAHCVENSSAASIGVWLDINDLDDTSGAVYRNVKAIFLHPSYRADAQDNLFNDIALLLLESPVTTVTPIDYRTSSTLPNDTFLYALGWGQTESNPAFPTILQQTFLYSDPRSNGQPFFNNALGPEHLLASEPGQDTCQGDSGGPLFDPILDELVGITSFGLGCADGIPGVYANVGYFSTWLDTFLAQPTDVDPVLSFKSGANDLIDGGGASRLLRTDFGRRLRGGKSKVIPFSIANGAGTSPAVIHRVVTSGRAFSAAATPAYILGGTARNVRIRFRAPNRRKITRSSVRIFTNDADVPVFTFNVLGRSKPKKKKRRRGGTGFF